MLGRMRLVSAATVAGAVQFDMRSGANGRTYRIYVYEPRQEPPPGGYPVLYITDGNACFCTAAMQAEMMERSVLIVGIGYPTPDRREPDILRLRDFTWTSPSDEVAADLEAYLQSRSISYGGAEEFFRFLTEEVGPAVAASWEVDCGRSTLFGHSIGGLFALHLLLRHPESFRAYVAGSPSIWWNDKAILREVPSFRQAIESKQVAPRVLITMGSLEGSTEGLTIPDGMDRQRFEEMIRTARMVDNARELAAELGTVRGVSGYQVESHLFDGETHQSVVAGTISRALRFATRI